MKRRLKPIIVMLILAIYGLSVVLLRGNLPNQTSTLVDFRTNYIQSLTVNSGQSARSVSLNHFDWDFDGQNVIPFNENESLVVSGTYTNYSLPVFTATQVSLNADFGEDQYLRAVLSSDPAVALSFRVGLANSTAMEELINNNSTAITAIDQTRGIVWVSLSYPEDGEKIDSQTHYVSINIAKKIQRLGLNDRSFVGMQLQGLLIEPSKSNNSYKVEIVSIQLVSGPQYGVSFSHGNSTSLTDGSVAFLFRKTSMLDSQGDHPYLQRVYVEYEMETFQNAFYTIFLINKGFENLTAVRIGFVFIHDPTNLFEIGTYVDWKRPTNLDHDFDPISTLSAVMDEGDYALVFTPISNSKLQTVQIQKTAFTFSKLPHSAFTFSTISDEILALASIFTVLIAGVLPTILLLMFLFMYAKSRLKEGTKSMLMILTIGLVIRLTLAPISAYPDDTQIFAQLGALYYGSGVLGAQWVSLPGFVYLETIAYMPYALLRTIGFQDFQYLMLDIYSVEALFTKIPAILSDFGSAYYIHKLAKKFSPKHSMLLPGLYLLNPLTIYISAILGQFDSIFTFALIAFTYYLTAQRNTLKATLYSSFSAILNPVGIATFIQHFVTAGLKEKKWTVVKSILLAITIFSISLVPFAFERNSPLLISSYERIRGGIPAERFYGKQLNFYMYGTRFASSVGYGLTFRFLLEMFGIELGFWFYPSLAALSFLAIVVLFIYKMRKAHIQGAESLVYTGTFMLSVASLFQLTFPTIFDQFVVWIVGLLLVSFVLCKEKRFLSIFILISISTGFLYVFAWRDYLALTSGADIIPLGNATIATILSLIIGTFYSLILVTILFITLKTWIQYKEFPKT